MNPNESNPVIKVLIIFALALVSELVTKPQARVKQGNQISQPSYLLFCAFCNFQIHRLCCLNARYTTFRSRQRQHSFWSCWVTLHQLLHTSYYICLFLWMNREECPDGWKPPVKKCLHHLASCSMLPQALLPSNCRPHSLKESSHTPLAPKTCSASSQRN